LGLFCAFDGTFWNISESPDRASNPQNTSAHGDTSTQRAIVRQFDAQRARNPRVVSKTHNIAADCRKSFCARGVELAHGRSD